MKKLNLYIVKFEEVSIIKPKVYSFNGKIGRNKQQLIIIITYNKYMFFANNRI